MGLLSDLFHSLIRTLGFFGKELISVLRQPKLLGSLVLGPFVILLLFGLGYRGQRPEFRTTLVVPNDPSVSSDPAAYAQVFQGVFKLQDVGHDEAAARAELSARQTDVVVLVPANAIAEIYAGRQAQLTVLYDEADPSQSAWIRYFSYVQTSELNRGILAEVLRQSKGPAAQALDFASQSRVEVDALDSDLRSGNLPSASVRAARLLATTQATRIGIATALDALVRPAAAPVGAGEAVGTLMATEQELAGIQSDLARGPAGVSAAQQRAQRVRQNTESFSTLAQRIEQIPPETLVSPLAADARNVVPFEPTPIAFYTPAVLALLLQHIGLTLSALSAVRDRLLGSMELFRVTPVGAGNILFGKSLGYALLLAVVGGLLTAAATLLLHVPFFGNVFHYCLVLGLTIFASVALGFALSVFASSDSQAVQFSMLALLASVFFGGFFLPLEQLFPWLRGVSYALPVTYGAQDLRDVMLRGVEPSLPLLIGPALLGLLFYLIAAVGLRHQLRRA
jgi:ABC-2 type transport system permease protein